MSADKAQLAALSLHLEQQRTISVVYRAEGKRLAVAEVECIALAGRVYSAAEVIEMAQEYEMIRKPLSDAEMQEVHQAALQIVARVELVRAALRWIRSHEPMDCEECNALVQAVKAFRDAGGSEATG